MRIAALLRPKEPLVLLERPTPEPGAGQVLVRVSACGLGLADWNHATLDVLPHEPFVPGLEAAGVVEQVGLGVELLPGTRVGVTPLAWVCGACLNCERGLPGYCERVAILGLHRPGALGTHVIAEASQLIDLPADVNDVEAAVLMGSGWAAQSALRAAAIAGSAKLGVIGVGGVGHLVIQLAYQAGLEVWAVDLEASRERLGQTLGARPGIAQQSVDAVIVCTPSTQAIQLALRSVRKAGIIVLVGASPTGRVDLPIGELVSRGLTVKGSWLGAPSDVREVLELAARDRLKVVVTQASLDDAPAKLWSLRDLEHQGRLVFTPRQK